MEHWQHYEFTDFDRDSQNELIIESDQQNIYIDPQRGGTLFEWDARRSMHNMLSVMSRHEEGYHRTLREFEQERRKREALAAQQSADTSFQWGFYTTRLTPYFSENERIRSRSLPCR